MLKKSLATIAFLAAGTLPALAHLDPGEHGSFAAGFTHPIFGTDHVLAMIAVGLWAVVVARGHDRSALWLVPAAFVGTMLLGFLAAMGGLPLPFVEPVILASVVAIGLLAAIALKVPAPAAMAMVGFFAFFHGHAHGGEIGDAGAGAYAAGFAAATALLHAAGLLLGVMSDRLFGGSTGLALTRVAGAATAAGGLWLAMAG